MLLKRDCVAPIGLYAIASGSGCVRGRDNVACAACFNELTVEPVAARAGLIRELQFSVPLRQFLDHRRDGVGAVREAAKATTLAGARQSVDAIRIGIAKAARFRRRMKGPLFRLVRLGNKPSLRSSEKHTKSRHRDCGPPGLDGELGHGGAAYVLAVVFESVPDFGERRVAMPSRLAASTNSAHVVSTWPSTVMRASLRLRSPDCRLDVLWQAEAAAEVAVARRGEHHREQVPPPVN
jgi:hypothetical protein